MSDVELTKLDVCKGAVEEIKLNSELKTSNMIMDTIEEIECSYNNKGSCIGIPTGYYELDTLTCGLQKSELTILAARHSMGKTALALNIAQNVAIRSEIPVLFVSYEMNEKIITRRILSSEAKVDAQKMKSGELQIKEWENITKVMGELGEMLDSNLKILAKCGLKFNPLADEIRAFVDKNPDCLVIVDYFQLIPIEGKEDKYAELATLAASFKRLAVENDIPIILLSQLSRKVDERPDKRPCVADLSECDALAQHSDNIIFLHRDEYYGKDDPELKNIATIIVGKQNNGVLGDLKLLFQGATTSFKNKMKWTSDF